MFFQEPADFSGFLRRSVLEPLVDKGLVPFASGIVLRDFPLGDLLEQFPGFLLALQIGEPSLHVFLLPGKGAEVELDGFLTGDFSGLDHFAQLVAEGFLRVGRR